MIKDKLYVRQTSTETFAAKVVWYIRRSCRRLKECNSAVPDMSSNNDNKRKPMNPTVEDIPDEDLPFASPPHATPNPTTDESTQTQPQNDITTQTTAATTARPLAEPEASTTIATDTSNLPENPTTNRRPTGAQPYSSRLTATMNRITTQGPGLYPTIHGSLLRPPIRIPPPSQPSTTQALNPATRPLPQNLFYVTTVSYLPNASATQKFAYPLQRITRTVEAAMGILRAEFAGRRVEVRVWRLDGGEAVEARGMIEGRAGWEVVRADVWECVLDDDEGSGEGHGFDGQGGVEGKGKGWAVGAFGAEGEPGAFWGVGDGWAAA